MPDFANSAANYWMERSCPACGVPAKVSARFCRLCGQHLLSSETDTSTPVATTPTEPSAALDVKLDQLQRYLPSHLSEKILANRGRLQGERKLVTVLFTDLVGYTAMSA